MRWQIVPSIMLERTTWTVQTSPKTRDLRRLETLANARNHSFKPDIILRQKESNDSLFWVGFNKSSEFLMLRKDITAATLDRLIIQSLYRRYELTCLDYSTRNKSLKINLRYFRIFRSILSGTIQQTRDKIAPSPHIRVRS